MDCEACRKAINHRLENAGDDGEAEEAFRFGVSVTNDQEIQKIATGYFLGFKDAYNLRKVLTVEEMTQIAKSSLNHEDFGCLFDIEHVKAICQAIHNSKW